MIAHLVYFAAAIELSSVIPYVYGMVRGKTKPNVISWAAWASLSFIETLASFAEHAYNAGILGLSSTILCTTVVLFGLKYGFAKFKPFDAFCLAGAALAVFVWYIFHSAKLGLYASIFVDFIVAMPTVYHAWHRFREESALSYAMGVGSGTITMFSLSHFDAVNMALPLLIVSINAAVVVAVLHGRLHYSSTRRAAAIKAARTRKRNKSRSRLMATARHAKLRTYP